MCVVKREGRIKEGERQRNRKGGSKPKQSRAKPGQKRQRQIVQSKCFILGGSCRQGAPLMRPLGNILNLRGNNNNNNNNASQSKKAEEREKNNARATKFGQAVNENRALQRFPQLTYVSHAAALLLLLLFFFFILLLLL